MAGLPRSRTAALSWSGRLETRVAIALAVLVGGALGAMLLITIQLVSTQSRTRAEDELDVARSAFSSLMENRAASSIALTTLVTELPVFRAHLTDARLAEDRPTIDAMADGYRRQLESHFVVVTNGDGTWLANPGWADTRTPPPEALVRLLDAARHGTSGAGIVGRGGELFLAVSVPARFADEVLGTLTTGYRLTDDLAEELARLAQCEVVLISGTQIAASSLEDPAHSDTARLVAEVASAAFGMLPQVRRIGDHQYVGGIFPLRPAADNPQGGRLLLLADWRPTQQFVDRLRGRFLAGGLVVFGLALAGGVTFSRRVSRPLRDIAAAAADIANGNLSLQLPVRGSAEDRTVAHAFNEMSASLRVAHQRLIHDAIHDPLTLLPNRVLFMERLERAMARKARHPDYHFAVLFIDVDRFKHVNDSLGHTVGDQLLVAFSERLASLVRHDDTVTRIAAADADGANTLARFGGDEFVMLIDDMRDPIDAVRVAERVQEIAARSLPLGAQDVFVSTSIGVAVCSPDHHSGDEVVRDADLAMYRAKSAGGCRYAVFDAAMHQEALERLRLETELRRAIERQEFRLWYQPIVALEGQQVAGFEALVRWQHPERGLLDPGAFLKVAEEIGVIASIDQWALGEACRQGQQWRRERPDRSDVTVSVNLSAKGFGSDSLVPRVIDVLRSTGFPARGLRLEITESVAISDADRVRSVLKRAARARRAREPG